MKYQDPVILKRLIALVEEAEMILARGITSHDIRHSCALARGYLELARAYGEPVRLEDVERVLSRMRAAVTNVPISDDEDASDFLECDFA